MDNDKQYLRIRDQLAEEIAAESFRVGDKLPSERELSAHFMCTRITTREALAQLEAEGLIYRRNRRGWFVTPPRLVFWPTRKSNFIEIAQQQHRVPGASVLTTTTQVASAQIRKSLDLPPGAKVHEIRRLRTLEGRPVLYEIMYFCAEKFPDLLERELDKSLTRLLRDSYRVEIGHEHLRITSATIDPSATGALEVLPGRSGIRIDRLREDQDKRSVELDLEYWISDAIEIRVETQAQF